MHISSYDVKLYNPDTGREVIRRTQGYETFYILTDEDEGFRQDMTTVQVSLPWISCAPVLNCVLLIFYCA